MRTAMVAFVAAFLGSELHIALADEIKVGSEQVIATGPTLGQPRAAFGQGTYLVVWQDGWSGVGATSDIMGIRLKADTLEAIDKKPLRICSAPDAQEAPAVAYVGGNFFVVWQDFRNGKSYQVRGALVDAKSGAVRDKDIGIAGGDKNQLRPSVACDGRSFLVVWQDSHGRDAFGIRGVRISAAGKVLDASPHEYAALGTSPTVSASGNKMLVAWTNRDRNRATTGAALVDPASGAKIKDLGTINSCCGDSPQSAGDGMGNFVTVSSRASVPDPWGWGGPGAVVLSRVLVDMSMPESKLNYAYRLSNLCSRSVPNVVDAAVWKGSKTWDAGAVGGFPGTQDGLWPTGSSAVVHAGKGLFLFAWVKGTLAKDKLTASNLDVWVRGMDAKSLAIRVPDQNAAAALDADETHPVLISARQSEALLLYSRLRSGAGRQIAVRRVSIVGSN